MNPGDDDEIMAQQEKLLKAGKAKGPKKPLLSSNKDKTTFDSANFFKEQAEKEQKGHPPGK